MGLDILNRLKSYLFPLTILAVAFYGAHSFPARSFSKRSPFLPGAFLVLLEIATFQTRPEDVLDRGRLVDRLFGKVWLRIGQSS